MKKILLSAIAASSFIYANETYDISLNIGGSKTQSSLSHEDHKNIGIRFGMPNQFALEDIFDTIELGYDRSSGVDFENSLLDTNINRYNINMLSHFDGYGKIVPYTLMGIGYEDFSKEYLNTNDSSTLNLGLGLKYFLNDSWFFKAEVKDQINLEEKREHTLIYTTGLGFVFGEKAPKQPQTQVEETKIEEPQQIIKLDDDKDGVLNENDDCPNTMTGFSVDDKGCPLNYTFKVQFDTNKDIVKDIYEQNLIKFVDFMNMMPNYKAKIQGHTDSVGSKKYNMKLSQKRAAAVTEKLIRIGLDAKRVTAEGFGEENPIASNETAEGKAQNRRVEAVLIK